MRVCLGKGAAGLEAGVFQTALPQQKSAQPSDARPSFIDAYVAYASAQTDAPYEFSTGLAYGLLSAIAGPRVYLRLGAQQIRPNLYLIMAGTSTISRKSTSLSIGGYIAKQADVAFGASEMTPEALLMDMTESPHQVFTFPEFGGMLRHINSRSHLQHLKTLLTDLYDCPSQYTRRTMRRSFHIIRPILSVWACTTIDWLLEAVTESDVCGGFLPRFLFFLAEGRRPPMPFPPPPNEELELFLVAWLKKVKTVSGEIMLSPASRALYERWFCDVETQKWPPLLTTFRGRYQTAALKLSILEQMARRPGLVVDDVAMNSAIQRINEMLEQLRRFYRDDLFLDPAARDRKRILDSIRVGNTDHCAIMRDTRLNKNRMDNAIKTLIESEILELVLVPRTDHRGGANRRVYRLLVDNNA